MRNLAVGALRLAGHPNLAVALRHTGRDPARPLAVLGLAYRWNGRHSTMTEPWEALTHGPDPVHLATVFGLDEKAQSAMPAPLGSCSLHRQGSTLPLAHR